MKKYSDSRNRLTDKRARCGWTYERSRSPTNRSVSIGSVSIRDKTYGGGRRRRRRDQKPRPLPSAIRRRVAGARTWHLRGIRTRSSEASYYRFVCFVRKCNNNKRKELLTAKRSGQVVFDVLSRQRRPPTARGLGGREGPAVRPLNVIRRGSALS